MLLQKTKEIYKQRCLELEKLKRDNGSTKELEKSEAKFKKAQVRKTSLINVVVILFIKFLLTRLGK